MSEEFGEGIPNSSLVKAEEFLNDPTNYSTEDYIAIPGSGGGVNAKKLADWLVGVCREIRTGLEQKNQDITLILAQSRSENARRKTELAAASMALGMTYDKLVEAGRNPQTNVDTALGIETPWTQADIDRLRLEAEELLQMAMVDISKSQMGGDYRIDLLKYADMSSNPKPGEVLKHGTDDGGSAWGGGLRS